MYMLDKNHAKPEPRAADDHGEGAGMKILKDIDTPLHAQLENFILEEIHQGKFKPGDRVYSEPELARRLGISRTTVRIVFDRLVSRNVLVRRPGKGTFVSFPVQAGNGNLLVGLSSGLQKAGIHPRTVIVGRGVELATSKARERLHLGQRDEVVVLQRVRSVNEIPFVIHTAFLPRDRFEPLLRADLESIGLTDYIRNVLKVPINRAEETISVAPATAEQAKWLKVKPGFPLLVVEGVTYDFTERPIRLSISRYHSELVHIRTTPSRRNAEG
jgi:DNA-binding GntR family transcriptional regulator